MDTDLKCNRLTCRRALTDKAVVVSLITLLKTSIISALIDNETFRLHVSMELYLVERASSR